MEESAHGFDDFSVEMADFEVKKVGKFDRMWKIGPGGSSIQRPLIVGETIYFGSFNQFMYAVDKRTGGLVWKYRCDGPIGESSPRHWDGCIYFGSFDYNLYCLDAATGKLRWKFRANDVIYSECVIDGGRVFFGSKDRFVYCLDCRDGRLIWKFETQDEIVSAPSVGDGMLYIGSLDHNFYCLDESGGGIIWKIRTQGEVHIANGATVHDGTVYFASFDNHLYAADAKTGRIQWKFPTGQYGNAIAPVIHADRLYHSTRDGSLFCLTLGGGLVWKYVNTRHMCIPIIHRGRIYIGSEDLNMHCFSLSGEKLWSFKTEGLVFIGCAAEGDTVFFTSWDCNLYAVDTGTRRLAWKFRMEGSPSYLPPPYGSFEVVMMVGGRDFEDARMVDYGPGFLSEERNVSAYKSEMTYQSGTTYRAKGKYQIDSQKERF